MDRTEAAALLRHQLRGYAGRTHAELAQRVGEVDVVEVEGASGIENQVEVSIFWEGAPAGPIRVIGSIDDGTFRASFTPVTDDFVKYPDGLVDARWSDDGAPPVE